MRATAAQVIKNARVVEKMRRFAHPRGNRCAGPISQVKKMRRGGNRAFLEGNATTGAEANSMRGRQIRCAGRKIDAGEESLRGEKMRSSPGPGENDARMHPPTRKNNAQRVEKRPARCTRHQGRGRCPSEFLSITSSRRAIVCLYLVCMGPSLLSIGNQDRSLSKNFKPERILDRIRSAL